MADLSLTARTVDDTDTEFINGLEGKNLLSALTAFVTRAVISSSKAHNKQGVVLEWFKMISGCLNMWLLLEEQALKFRVERTDEKPLDLPQGENHVRDMSISLNLNESNTAVARSELEIKTLNATRAHVFNKMPVHLLAFDKDGSNIQLIGRNKIFSRILPCVLAKIAEPDFQTAWAVAEVMKDSKFMALSDQYRSNRMKALLKGAIEQSVDYAILSHTWLRDTPSEITFQDWAAREHTPRVVMCRLRPKAKSQAKPGQKKPGQAGPWWPA